MGKIVTYPPEKHPDGKQFDFRNIKTNDDRAIMARILLENVRKWVADPTRDVIYNMDLDMGPPSGPLSQDELEQMDKAGRGSFGHTTVFEPHDLELYESYMYPPLRMPEKPEVMVSYWDMNQGIVNFIEGRMMVKTLCPDGLESWLVILIPVPNFHTALEGNCWGWPKYVADEMSVEKDHSEVIYEGKPSWTMDFTPGGGDDAAIAQLKANGTEGGNTVSFHINGGSMTMLRQGEGPEKARENYEQHTYFAEWEPGMIKTWIRPEDPASGLVPPDCVSPGVWQRSFGKGTGSGGGMWKVKSE